MIAKEQYRLDTGAEIEGFEVKGWHFLYRTIETFAPVIFTAVILLICTPMVMTPFKKQLNIEKVFPINYLKKVTSRVFSTWILGTIALFILYFLCFLVGTIRNGTGSISYPILVYSENDYWVEPLWKVLGKSTLLFIFIILAIIVTLQVISQITKNNLATLFLAMFFILKFMINFLMFSS